MPRRFGLAGLNGNAEAIFIQRPCCTAILRISSATSDRSWSWLNTRATSSFCWWARLMTSMAKHRGVLSSPEHETHLVVLVVGKTDDINGQAHVHALFLSDYCRVSCSVGE